MVADAEKCIEVSRSITLETGRSITGDSSPDTGKESCVYTPPHHNVLFKQSPECMWLHVRFVQIKVALFQETNSHISGLLIGWTLKYNATVSMLVKRIHKQDFMKCWEMPIKGSSLLHHVYLIISEDQLRRQEKQNIQVSFFIHFAYDQCVEYSMLKSEYTTLTMLSSVLK